MATTEKPSSTTKSAPKKAGAGERVKAAARRKSAAGAETQKSASQGEQDAIQLLKADHHEVEAMFERYEQLDDDDQKLELAETICLALTVHTRIEEEIFYPAYRKATGDDDLADEATVEHQAAKDLIGQIEAMEPEENLYDARVKVLSEEIQHHVEEEEKPEEGMFARARAAKMDLKELGRRMAERKQQLLMELAGD